MFGNKLITFVILIIILDLAWTDTPYCQVSDITPVADPSIFPVLPSEFQTRVQASFIHDKQTVDFFLSYDYYDQKAEIVVQESANHDRRVFYYDKNEYFTITNYRKCFVKKINESIDEFNLFGLVVDQNGLFNMLPVNTFLHFNNEFPHQFVGKEMLRGIPVNHFRSCQNWDALKANVLIDYYFSSSEFQQSVGYPNSNLQVPVTATVKGYIYMNQKNARSTYIENEYNFYEFRSFIERKQDLFVQPEGIYCSGQTFKADIPQIPKSFSFVEEVLIDDLKLGVTRKIHYSYDLKIARYDSVSIGNYKDNTPIKILHDFNSGVGYLIDKNAGNCSTFPLGNELDSISLSQNGAGIKIKDPNEYFYIDDTYFYVGQRVERGIVCDVFVSNRTDFKSPFLATQPNYWVFEIYFMALNQVDESSDIELGAAPIAIKITPSEGKGKYVINIYDFDPIEPDFKLFDLSSCYQSKGKTQFAISFSYANDIDVDTFRIAFEKSVEKGFYKPMLSALGMYNISPFRIIPPTIVSSKSGFTIYSGITDFAPPINYFRRLNQVRVNINKAPYKAEASNPENCAYLCLKDSSLNNNFYRCLSFDLCLNEAATPNNPSYICSFYNSSFTTDQSLILDTEPLCDHYSKNVASIDSVSKEDAFRTIENSIVKNEFFISFQTGEAFLVFPANDIYPATLEASQLLGITTGSSSFYEQFSIISPNLDFRLSLISLNTSIQLRERKGVSIDECSRLCLIELAFRCESVSYESILRECKWSSLWVDFVDYVYVEKKDGYTMYLRNPLYNYDELPFKVSAGTDLREIKVRNANECAIKCNSEANFKCRSFNLCDDKSEDDLKYKCLLSDRHNHDVDKDPNLIYTPICTHYSRKNIEDFKLVPGVQLNVKPQAKYVNSSVEICSTMCSYLESFVCRSFDYFLDTNTCFLYTENVKDNIHFNVEFVKNENCNHYSREYFVENGISVDAQEKTVKGNKYSTKTIFGIVTGCLNGGAILGTIAVLVYSKLLKKKQDLPPISFSNPNASFD